MGLSTPAPSYTAGQILTAAQLNTLQDGIQAVWTTYAPAWTAITTNPTIGNGTLTGGFMLIGKTVNFWALMVSGSTTTYGSGGYQLSLPITPKQSGFNMPSLSLRIKVASYYMGTPYQSIGTTLNLGVHNSVAGGPLSAVSPTVPATFVSGSVLSLGGSYEAA